MNEENIENGDSLNSEEVVVPETAEDTEVELQLEAEPEVDVAKLQETNKKLYARLKALEGKVKATPKQVTPPKQETLKEEQYLTREEAILIAKGYEDGELAKLKAIAKGSNCSLLDATKDEMFVVWKEKQEVENKKSKSQLGASKGSGSVRAEKSVSDMTEAEHEAYVSKMFGN